MEHEGSTTKEWTGKAGQEEPGLSIAHWVRESYETAELFWTLGIDYWTKGHRSLARVCESKNLVYEDLVFKLEKITRDDQHRFPDCAHWPLELIADYVEKVHHPFLYREFPRITEDLHPLTEDPVEGEEEWAELKERFALFSGEVSMHMRKEEMLVFPRIRKLCSSKKEDQLWSLNALPSLPKLFSSLLEEHDQEAEHLTRILDLIEQLNARAVGKRQQLIDQLEEDLQALARDFRFHTHLENNILFPQVSLKEKDLQGFHGIPSAGEK